MTTRRATATPTKATTAKKKTAAAKKTAPATAPAKKSAPAKQTAPAKATTKKPAQTKKPAPVTKVAAPARKTAARKTAPAKGAVKLAPTSGLSAKDLTEIRGQIDNELRDLRHEYEETMRSLDDLQRQATDTAGDDQADTGSKTFEREQEMSIAQNRLDLITQMEHAVHRITDGTYGSCENCGNPIPKARLQAFPSATLCVNCKAREERR